MDLGRRVARDDRTNETRGATLIETGVWIAAGVALAVAWIAVFPVRRYAHRLGLLDRPNERSSHVRTTPRGGGIGIIAGMLAGLTVAGWFMHLVGSVALTVVGAACLVAAAGLVDDVRGLSPWARLIIQVLAAAIVLSVTGPLVGIPLLGEELALPMIWGGALSLLWITAVTNFFNFMDGFDGLAASQAVASCLGVVLAGWGSDASLLALLMGAACVGFLFHNWAPARVFMGDVGSGFLGFTLAALPFLAPDADRSTAMLAAAVGLSLFLLDPALTLVRRAAARKPLTESHREHLYQQFALPGEPVRGVVTIYAALAILLAVGGAFGYRNPELLPWFVLGSVAVFATVCIMALRAERQRRRAF
jgi:Fuc2NAc and GlcNAc transferase